MNWTAYLSTLAVSVSMSLGAAISSQAQQANMSFFVTSVGSGKGADPGGLPGADQHCQQLAQAAGAGNHTWHAYLSAQGSDGQPAVNARDRIGRGPWQNSKGVVVAKDVDELHGDAEFYVQMGLAPECQRGLIRDVVVEAGNPDDAERFLPMLDRQIAAHATSNRKACWLMIDRLIVHRNSHTGPLSPPDERV
jgi:hypothetical protein